MPKIVFTTSTIKIRNKVGPLPTPFVKISLYHIKQFILKYANAAKKEQRTLISGRGILYHNNVIFIGTFKYYLNTDKI